ncbi:hypothetical protein [Sulfobacillus harzensis]|uniref:Uncharacterized protein n=1 Tax=Sulfobacillus harzensis TaxID=2729629 RepID=A0A7Y0L8A1_9FIRM|nr:hypothetical protein [Sulfobacillus harzensis]NMP23739.1 hypothetical protein [Sulfobacillus harzensis]
MDTTCWDVYDACAVAVQQGQTIEAVSDRDKEFHFQNWFQSILEGMNVQFDVPSRNAYPDFRMVVPPEGYEVKGLAWPGRERDYDANSQVPSGCHNGRQIFYVFGRYPADLSDYPKNRAGHREYPVVDLIICHGDFLNVDHDYVHKNRHVKGFGSYGDIMIRDRKMYVAPTPFALTTGTTGLMTLIVPEEFEPNSRFRLVGELERREAQEIVIGYHFDLRTNVIESTRIPNPTAGVSHRFRAYRLKTQADKIVTMQDVVDLEPEVDE